MGENTNKKEITDSKTEKTGIAKRLENLRPAWKKGQTGNPNGRPFGQRNFNTIYQSALTKLAKLNDKTPEELEDEIISTGLLNARKANFAFYKDTLDRLHGTATQRTDITTKGQPIVQLSKEIAEKHHIETQNVLNSGTESNS